MYNIRRLFLFFVWLYYTDKNGPELIAFKQEAKTLSAIAMERNWLFCYEVLEISDFPEGELRTLKSVGISFLKEFSDNTKEPAEVVAPASGS